VLRLYGPAALSASTGSSRVAHGSIVFLNQCYSSITPKNEISLQNRVREEKKFEKAALQHRKNDTSSVLRPVPLPFPLPLPLDESSSLPYSGAYVLNIRKEVFLKLSPSSGSLHVLIINGADCVGRGVCRGAYPKLFRQADILSTWCEQNLSLTLSRFVRTVQYSTVQYSVLCCAVLCCAVLCCAVLCCAVLCCAVLCCAVLFCAVLCSAVLCSAV
jgi:hypothetical protein